MYEFFTNNTNDILNISHKKKTIHKLHSNKDKEETPYEINISLFDAMQETFSGNKDFHFDRFLCIHIIMLSLEGVPAFYIHSLL